MSTLFWDLQLELEQLLKKEQLTQAEIHRLVELRDQIWAA